MLGPGRVMRLQLQQSKNAASARTTQQPEVTALRRLRKLPPFEQSLGATILMARESVMAPLRPILRDQNITEPQWRVMRIINDRSVAEATRLAEVAFLHAPSVTRILRELQRRKLVVRMPDPHDRRRSTVVLSGDGRKLVKTVSRVMVRILGEYSDRFSSARLERLMDELRALSSAVKGIE